MKKEYAPILVIINLIFIIIIGNKVNIFLHNKDIQKQVIENESSKKEQLSQARYNKLKEMFSDSGYHKKLNSFIILAMSNNNKIVKEHFSTQWLDQLTYITVRSTYIIREKNNSIHTLTVQAKISDDNKILKYEVISYE